MVAATVAKARFHFLDAKHFDLGRARPGLIRGSGLHVAHAARRAGLRVLVLMLHDDAPVDGDEPRAQRANKLHGGRFQFFLLCCSSYSRAARISAGASGVARNSTSQSVSFVMTHWSQMTIAPSLATRWPLGASHTGARQNAQAVRSEPGTLGVPTPVQPKTKLISSMGFESSPVYGQTVVNAKPLRQRALVNLRKLAVEGLVETVAASAAAFTFAYVNDGVSSIMP
jgi:hypothetical protein